ncbi:phytoene desaturase family protein [Actinoplanes derwentensis]|uniref:4,4'-diaponeurosporene oxygenase n=1 Tax=Actinoplanes derwentensis TaxID=113562 RepID=A0A1H2C165_9ACTN|nr:phytoene desaturase family protein [Actinoplanes derwentensis]GID84651.1 phytoene desaturase [Actinoplanes derwentensis]SDT63919.1 phytoene desaturase [Actinoplanes derwentensis]
MSNVVVIGAGVGGLAAALRLAKAGHRVTVHERSADVGGKLAVHERDGFRFDTGPSLLTLPKVFEELGLGLRPVPLDPVVRHVFPDGTVLDSSPDHAVFLERISTALGPDAAADWDRFWRRAARIWRASWESVLQRPVSATSLARMSWRVADLAAIAPGRSLRSLGRRYLRDPRLRMLLDRYATYTGTDPRRAPAALAAIPYAELAHGGWYLPGGLGTLSGALRAKCDEAGVRVELGSEVTAIEADHRVRGVRLAGGAFVPADVVVSNVDAISLYRDLLPSPRRLTGLADRSLAGFVLLLGVRGRTPELAHHTVFFPRDYDAEFDAIFPVPGRRARPVDDPAVFVTRADDPAVRPDGSEAWFVLVNTPRHGTGWSAVDWRRPGLAQAYANRILEVLQDRGVDLRGRLEFMETRTPADLADATGAPGGAIYGTAGGLLRPANRGPVDGLHLVGGSVHPGGGLPMVALSARIVADQIGPA